MANGDPIRLGLMNQRETGTTWLIRESVGGRDYAMIIQNYGGDALKVEGQTYPVSCDGLHADERAGSAGARMAHRRVRQHAVRNWGARSFLQRTRARR